MGKTIYELQQERVAQQSKILIGIAEAYAEARHLKLTEAPYLDELTAGQRNARTLRERADASREAWEVGKEEWLKVEAEYASEALARIEELKELLFGDVRETPMEVRTSLSTMTEPQLENMLVQAEESSDEALALLVLLVAHTRDFPELRVKFFEAFDAAEDEGEEPSLADLYAELQDAPSEEELERIVEEASVLFEQVAPPVPRPNEMTANARFYG